MNELEASPSDLSDDAVGEGPDEELAQFVHAQQADGERDGDEPVLDGDGSGAEEVLDALDLGDKDGDDQRAECAHEEPGVATLLADRVGLEDRQTLVANREQVTPLQNDERDKVDTLARVEEAVELVERVAVEAISELLEGEEEVADRDLGVPPHVEEEHRVRGDGLHHADEEVALSVDRLVDQVVRFGVPGLEREQVELLLFKDEREAADQIGEAADDDHEERAERQRHAKEDVEHDGPVLGPRAGGEQVRDDLLQVLEHESSETDALDDGAEVAHEDEIGGLHGDVRARNHGNTDIGGLERRSVVDTVTGHGDDASTVAQLVDDAQLLLGCGACKDDLLVSADDVPLLLGDLGDLLALDEQTGLDDVLGAIEPLELLLAELGTIGGEAVLKVKVGDAVRLPVVGKDADHLANGSSGERKVTSDHEEARSGPAALGDGVRDVGAGRVHDSEQTHDDEVGLAGSRNFLLVFAGAGLGIGVELAHGEQDDTLASTRPHLLPAHKLGSCSVVEDLGLAIDGRVVVRDAGHENVRSALDVHVVGRGSCGIVGVGAHDGEHELVLRVEGDVVNTAVGCLDVVRAGERSGQTKHGTVGGVALDGALGDGEVVGGGVKEGVVAKRHAVLEVVKGDRLLYAGDVVTSRLLVDEADGGDGHLVLGERAGLVGADDVDASEGLDGGDDGHTLGDEGDDETHEVGEDADDAEESGVVASEPSEPGDEHDEYERDGEADDDEDEARDLLLELGGLVLVVVGELVDAAHDGALTGEDDDADGVAVADVRAEERNVLGLEKVGVGRLDGARDLLGFAGEDGAVELEIGRGLDDAHVGRHLVTGGEDDDVADDEFGSGKRAVLAIADHDGVFGEEVEDGVHDLLGGVVLEGVEEGLEEDDDEHDDGEGEVVRLGRVAERLPGDEEDDDTDPQDGTEASKGVVQELEPVLVLLLDEHVLAVALEATSSGLTVETGAGGHIELLRQGFWLDGVEIERAKELGVGEVGFAALCRVDTLGFVHLDTQGAETDGDVGARGLCGLGARHLDADARRSGAGNDDLVGGLIAGRVVLLDVIVRDGLGVGGRHDGRARETVDVGAADKERGPRPGGGVKGREGMKG
ncbi:hypothetical protein L1887_45969 [Cichorium endivia]|nr:hypothetical protein L1887_45969 [Cichorium endivia]